MTEQELHDMVQRLVASCAEKDERIKRLEGALECLLVEARTAQEWEDASIIASGTMSQARAALEGE